MMYLDKLSLVIKMHSRQIAPAAHSGIFQTSDVGRKHHLPNRFWLILEGSSSVYRSRFPQGNWVNTH